MRQPRHSTIHITQAIYTRRLSPDAAPAARTRRNRFGQLQATQTLQSAFVYCAFSGSSSSNHKLAAHDASQKAGVDHVDVRVPQLYCAQPRGFSAAALCCCCRCVPIAIGLDVKRSRSPRWHSATMGNLAVVFHRKHTKINCDNVERRRPGTDAPTDSRLQLNRHRRHAGAEAQGPSTLWSVVQTGSKQTRFAPNITRTE